MEHFRQDKCREGTKHTEQPGKASVRKVGKALEEEGPQLASSLPKALLEFVTTGLI